MLIIGKVAARYLHESKDGKDIEIITIEEYRPGKFYNHYGSYKGHPTCGYYNSLEEAESWVLKQRPDAKKFEYV